MNTLYEARAYRVDRYDAHSDRVVFKDLDRIKVWAQDILIRDPKMKITVWRTDRRLCKGKRVKFLVITATGLDWRLHGWG